VLKNGSHLTAAMVWVQADDARYVDGDGQGHRVPLTDVDRTAARELNQSYLSTCVSRRPGNSNH
jgi:hypothetical protein